MAHTFPGFISLGPVVQQQASAFTLFWHPKGQKNTWMFFFLLRGTSLLISPDLLKSVNHTHSWDTSCDLELWNYGLKTTKFSKATIKQLHLHTLFTVCLNEAAFPSELSHFTILTIKPSKYVFGFMKLQAFFKLQAFLVQNSGYHAWSLSYVMGWTKKLHLMFVDFCFYALQT